MVLKHKRVLLECSAVAGAASLLVIAGCSLFSGRDEGLVFNHKVHAEKGISCDGCHEDYEDEPSAGMPTYETCLACHGPKSDRAPYPYEVLIQKEKPESSFVAGYRYYDVKFSHALHTEKEVPCAACHADVAESARVSSGHRPTPETCLSCHEEKGLSGDCTVCHQNLKKDVAPRTHGGAAWMKTHGLGPSIGAVDRGHRENCELCHSESFCANCHAVEKPQDHTEFFRIQGHGAYVSLRRERCMACHQENFCTRCHQESVPRSHYSASWGGSSSRHCLYCHLDSAESGCAVCHSSAPSHQTAPGIPQPPHPASTANCYQCHLQPPHADNGTPCTACHR